MGKSNTSAFRLSEPAAFVLPQTVEKLAEEHPNDTWITSPKDSDLATGWQNVTYQELANAVDGMARWTDKHFGVGNGNQVVAYIG